MRRHACCLLPVALLPALLFAWGEDGHHLIARLAVRSLPVEMPAFFRGAGQQLEFLSSEPDQWRDAAEKPFGPALLNGHNPDHFYKFEWYAPALLPPDRYQFYNAVRETGHEAAEMGCLPYRAEELLQRTRVNWRRWRASPSAETRRFLEAQLLADAGLLSHYIGDAAMPLHMSANYNGWKEAANPRQFTTDTTLHRRFESDFVQAHIRDGDVQPLLRPREQTAGSLAEIYRYMRRSYEQVSPLYEMEARQPFGTEGATLEQKQFVARRLADAASTLRDLWYGAYAGSAQ